MTRKEAEIEIIKKAKQGYLTNSMLLCLWKEDEEIPEYAEKLLWHKPEKPQDITIYMGLEGAKEFDKTLKEMFEKLNNNE